MKCPACQKRACSFLEWLKGPKMISHICPYCGQALRASRRTWVVLIVMFAAIPFVFYAAETICHRYGIIDHLLRKGVFALLSIAIVVPFSFIEWRTGNYRPLL
jgi:hypothetical protein